MYLKPKHKSISHSYFNKLLKIKFLKNKVFTKNCVMNFITTYEIQKRLKKILTVIYFFHLSNQKILFIDNSLCSPHYIELFKKTKHEVSNIELLNINNLFKKVSPPALVVMFNKNALLKEKLKKTNVPVISFNYSLDIFDGNTVTYKVPGDFNNSKRPKINEQSTNFFCQLIGAVLKKTRNITLNKDKYLWKLKKYLRKKKYYKHITKENVINFDTNMPTFYINTIRKNILYFRHVLREKKYLNREKWQVRNFKKLKKIPLWFIINHENIVNWNWHRKHKQHKKYLIYLKRRFRQYFWFVKRWIKNTRIYNNKIKTQRNTPTNHQITINSKQNTLTNHRITANPKQNSAPNPKIKTNLKQNTPTNPKIKTNPKQNSATNHRIKTNPKQNSAPNPKIKTNLKQNTPTNSKIKTNPKQNSAPNLQEITKFKNKTLLDDIKKL